MEDDITDYMLLQPYDIDTSPKIYFEFYVPCFY